MRETNVEIAVAVALCALAVVLFGGAPLRRSAAQLLHKRHVVLGLGAAMLAGVVLPVRQAGFQPSDIVEFVFSLAGLLTMALTGAGVALVARAAWPTTTPGATAVSE